MLFVLTALLQKGGPGGERGRSLEVYEAQEGGRERCERPQSVEEDALKIALACRLSPAPLAAAFGRGAPDARWTTTTIQALLGPVALLPKCTFHRPVALMHPIH